LRKTDEKQLRKIDQIKFAIYIPKAAGVNKALQALHDSSMGSILAYQFRLRNGITVATTAPSTPVPLIKAPGLLSAHINHSREGGNPMPICFQVTESLPPLEC
jgi:hypothetical protein